MLLPDLLQQAAHLNRIHAETAQQERRAFNVFTMLRLEDDEVNLHSRFLFELLNPKGTHGMGTAFLERFLAQTELDTFDVTTATVRREYQNIDIFITNESRQAIILENKIYAPDQPKQLQRYYKAVRKEGYRDVKVLYLTLSGDAPSADSAGDLDEEILTLISYADDVRDWLVDCIENIPLPPTIHMTLMQYQWLVEGLTGQAGGRKLKEVKELLNDEENLAAAVSISQALTEVKIDVQFAFWVALEQKLLAAGYDVVEFKKYSRKSVEDYYNKGKYRYGLMVSLPELSGQDILVFYIGVFARLYYGFYALENGAPVAIKSNQPGFVVLREILKSIDENWHIVGEMVGWKLPRSRIDFFNFDTNTITLIDPVRRDAYLDELVEEVTTAIDQFYAACEKDPRLQDEAAW